MKETLKLSDNVIARIVQILQEGLMTGTDITDFMRMIEMENVNGELQLTPAYVEHVRKSFDKINSDAQELASRVSEKE